MFKKTPCSSETKPIHTKLATWIRRLVAINKANGPALKTGLLLTQTELDELRLDSNGQLSASAPVPLNQGKFAATVEAARLAGHEIVQVLPHGVMRRPGSKAKRVPPVYVTCKKCWKALSSCGVSNVNLLKNGPRRPRDDTGEPWSKSSMMLWPQHGGSMSLM